jgi:ubiquinone/menaquinone biosynthesis C-methylase UbiE
LAASLARSNIVKNADLATVSGFGDEWTTFDQQPMSLAEASTIFNEYFSLFPWEQLPAEAVGFDLGCGSGRWARLVAPRVGELHCIDASEAALNIARRNLSPYLNCTFHLSSVDNLPLRDESMDFGYAIGVLHHVPDTGAGVAACAQKLKPGAPLLIYLYYAMDNRSLLFRLIWRATDLLRRCLCLLPHWAKLAATSVVAAVVYAPLAYVARLLELTGRSVDAMPLSWYRHKSFYTMRTDAYDRFATRLESRFRRGEVERIMVAAGLTDVSFREDPPYWCAIGYRSTRADASV